MNHPSKDAGEHARAPVTKRCLYRLVPDPTPGACQAAVAEDYRVGQQQGAAGTPTLFLDGTAPVGMQPLEVFEQAIEKAAREARDD